MVAKEHINTHIYQDTIHTGPDPENVYTECYGRLREQTYEIHYRENSEFPFRKAESRISPLVCA